MGGVGVFVRTLFETDEIARRRMEFGIDGQSWRSSRALRSLLMMLLVQIGEPSSHLRDKGILQRFPSVPWWDIRGFRNVVVHGYGSIDVDIAWESATVGVDELRGTPLCNAKVRPVYEDGLAAQSGEDCVEDILRLFGPCHWQGMKVDSA